MNSDSWTVFAAVVLPYVPYLMVAAEKWRRGIYDPNNPRESNNQLEGWSLRAKGAELNSWEALAAYVAVTWIAHDAGGDERVLTSLGAAWVLSRLLYLAAYVSGAGRWRIAAWSLGVALILARFGVVAG